MQYIGCYYVLQRSLSFVFFVKQKTAYDMRISDWSSDVCSSDLLVAADSPAHLPQHVAKGEDRAGADVGEDDAQRPQRPRQPRAARLGGVLIGGDARTGAFPAFGNRLLAFPFLAWRRTPYPRLLPSPGPHNRPPRSLFVRLPRSRSPLRKLL